jgi:hypothetical protein
LEASLGFMATRKGWGGKERKGKGEDTETENNVLNYYPRVKREMILTGNMSER